MSTTKKPKSTRPVSLRTAQCIDVVPALQWNDSNPPSLKAIRPILSECAELVGNPVPLGAITLFITLMMRGDLRRPNVYLNRFRCMYSTLDPTVNPLDRTALANALTKRVLEVAVEHGAILSGSSMFSPQPGGRHDN